VQCSASASVFLAHHATRTASSAQQPLQSDRCRRLTLTNFWCWSGFGGRTADTIWYATQAVALVFDHISIDSAKVQPPSSSPGSPAPADTSSGSANAALKLLDDLCLMASGAWALLPLKVASGVAAGQSGACSQCTL
jgi:hypothetical protein